jgi:hypothetical protein
LCGEAIGEGSSLFQQKETLAIALVKLRTAVNQKLNMMK